MNPSNYNNRETRPNLVMAFFSSTILIVMTAWLWELVDILTPFLIPFLMMGIWGIFLIVLIWSIVHVLRKKRYKNAFSFSPLILQAFTIVIIMTVPFTSIMLDLDFKRNLEEREKIISLIISGDLKSKNSQDPTLILLPSEYKHLSKGGGDIMVEHNKGETYVFFFSFRGILDNFSGFMYRSDDSPPQYGDFGGDFFEIKRIKKNWYWTASN